MEGGDVCRGAVNSIATAMTCWIIQSTIQCRALVGALGREPRSSPYLPLGDLLRGR